MRRSTKHRLKSPSHTFAAAGLLLALLLGACGNEVPKTEEVAAKPTHVDSVLPMPVMLARFRKDIPRITGLESGADSRDALVEGIVGALQAGDTLTMETLGVKRAEFAWLYFPTSINARPPYELPPALAWFQLQETNRKGVLRALRALGGHDLDYRGYVCGETPKVEDANRLWTGCAVTLAVDGAAPAPIKLFNTVLERDGRFAVLSYANDF